ncbi:MAG TPA: hypothetical protein VF681_10460 [Abditibacteriaceae bacterium]
MMRMKYFVVTTLFLVLTGFGLMAKGDTDASNKGNTSTRTRPSQPIESLSVKKYDGSEQRPVTLPASYKLQRNKVMKNVGSKTAVIIIHNKSGHNFEFFQLDLTTPGSSTSFAKQSYHGYGSLLNNEKRIIKVGGRAPYHNLRIIWGPVWDSQVVHYRERLFKGGVPYVFTINKSNKIAVNVWK